MTAAEDDAREAAAQRRIADACLGLEPVQGRLGLYRNLVQRNLATVVRRLLPRTADALDATHEAAFPSWATRFLAERAPRTPYLRDVPAEFVRWATPLWAADARTPPFLADLARYELDLFAIESAPRVATSFRVTEVSTAAPLVFAMPRQLARYDFAVHETGPSFSRRATHLYLHRDEENTVHSREIDEDKAGLLARLLDREPLGTALALESKERGTVADALAIASWLAELGRDGALLGGEG